MKIGIFDSGIGGLTVLKQLITSKPNNHYIYVGDTLNAPYGSKSKMELRIYADKIIKYFISREVSAIIIACGTVSSNLYKDLVKDYNIKIIDIITPTIDYINQSKYKNIGVVATTNTINSQIFENSLKNKNVYLCALPLLASLIEESSDQTEKYIDKQLINFKSTKIDLLVLGCTHYPIVDDIFSRKHKFKTLDMAIPLIKYIDEGKNSNVEIKFTKLSKKLIKNTEMILGRKYHIEKI